MAVKEYSMIRVDKVTLEKIRDMAPRGNISGFIRELAKGIALPAPRLTLEDLEVRFNALKSVMEKSNDALAKDLRQEFGDIYLTLEGFNMRIEALCLLAREKAGLVVTKTEREAYQKLCADYKAKEIDREFQGLVDGEQ